MRLTPGWLGGLTLALALAATATRAVAQHPLMALPLDDPAYQQLAALTRVGCGEARVSAFRPFTVADIRRALGSARSSNRCAGPVLDDLVARFLAPSDVAAGGSDVPGSSPDSAAGFDFGAALQLRGTALRNGEMHPIWRDVRPTSEGDPPLVARADLRLSWSGGSRIMAVVDAFGQTDRRNDPLIRARRFRSTSGVIDFAEAYISGKLGPVVLSVGRGREAWLGDAADPAESLMLSANGPPLDRILLDAQWTRFQFRALVGSVDDVLLTPARDMTPDSLGTQRWHRMLIAHALTFRPSSKLELTIGETGVIPRQGGGVALGFANPLMVYQVTQNDGSPGVGRDGGVNLTAFGSVRASFGPAAIQGELVIDDIQIDSDDRKVYPDQIAWNVLGSIELPLPLPASVALQYRRAGSFTYLSWSYANSWQQYGQPIASELGPDADVARLSGEVWPSGRLRLSTGVSRWRRGANRLDTRPVPSRQGHSGDPFPSTNDARPEVQRAWVADVGAQWLGPILPLTLRLEGARVENANNTAAASRTIARASLSATYRFRYP
ncbi:MAG TPA: hypothetical protein VFK04_09125 [Gemmatimonadaceae bacterium]|nr:hypothetical protein [Gemmatimonadaceae bacterium]